MCILKKNLKEEENSMVFFIVLYKNIDLNKFICSKKVIKIFLKFVRVE